MMRELPKCGYASEINGGTVTCEKGLYGGLPHIGVCMGCRVNGGDIKRPTISKTKKPCSNKHCRLGNIECESYWGCRDTCRVINERITSMDKCPNETI